jgi:hypothetical protein
MDFAAGVYLSDVQNPIPDTPTPYTLYSIRVYNILIYRGIFLREVAQRRGGWQKFTKIRRKYLHDCL